MRILQIMPFQNAKLEESYSVIPYDLIRGMALVEKDDGSTSIELILWRPGVHGIKVTDGCFLEMEGTEE